MEKIVALAAMPSPMETMTATANPGDRDKTPERVSEILLQDCHGRTP